MERKEFFRWIGFIFVFGVLILTISLTIFVIQDNLDLFGINSTQQTPYVIHLTLPQTSFSSQLFENNGTEKKIINNPILSADIALLFSGPLVEKTKVDVAAVGIAYPESRNEIMGMILESDDPNLKLKFPTFATVGFQGASPYKGTPFDTPNGEFPLNLAQDTDVLTVKRWDPEKPWPIYQSIEWDLQGTYFPIISITYKNGTISTLTYTDKPIHVGGSDVVRQERYAKISTLLTIALFVLTIVTSSELLYKLRPKIISNLIEKKIQKTSVKEQDEIQQPKINSQNVDHHERNIHKKGKK